MPCRSCSTLAKEPQERATTPVIVDLTVTADTDKKEQEHKRPTTHPYMEVVLQAQQEHKQKCAKLDPDSEVDKNPEWTTILAPGQPLTMPETACSLVFCKIACRFDDMTSLKINVIYCKLCTQVVLLFF